MFEMLYEQEILIEKVPLTWIPKIELFYPDLPSFPIMYIHNKGDLNERILACPVLMSCENIGDYCNIKFTVLTNIKSNLLCLNIIKEDILERLGMSNKISKEDILSYCNSNQNYENFFLDLWPYVEKTYGKVLPYGKFYEEIFSIIRFVSAWAPKTGRQSEMRMLYNFLSFFGESVIFPEKWSHLEFYIIPNKFDFKAKEFSKFPKFKLLFSTINKIFDNCFTDEIMIANESFKTIPKAWKQNKDYFINNVSSPLKKCGLLSKQEAFYADKLVDAFNRNTWRASFFISAMCNTDKQYESWQKDFFQNFYKSGSKLKGYSQKVFACFLQQGYKNKDIIPIDTWIETFYQYPLGISTLSQFYNSFTQLGKIERIIWLSSQANKTNMKHFFNILWCQRFGVTGNKTLRGINPIACYSCLLNKTCLGVKKHKNDKILFIDKIKILEEINSNFNAYKNSIEFICLTQNKIPKKIFKKASKKYQLIDEFSGYLLTEKDILKEGLICDNIISFETFVSH